MICQHLVKVYCLNDRPVSLNSVLSRKGEDSRWKHEMVMNVPYSIRYPRLVRVQFGKTRRDQTNRLFNGEKRREGRTGSLNTNGMEVSLSRGMWSKVKELKW